MAGGKDGLVHPGEVVTVLVSPFISRFILSSFRRPDATLITTRWCSQWAYSSTLPDELDLRPGMKVRVVRLYDDAWATGELVSGPQLGRQGSSHFLLLFLLPLLLLLLTLFFFLRAFSLSGAFPLVCVTLNGVPPSHGDASSIAPSRHSSDMSLVGGNVGRDSIDHSRYGSAYLRSLAGGGVAREPSPLPPLGRPLIASRGGDDGTRPDSPLDPFDRP